MVHNRHTTVNSLLMRETDVQLVGLHGLNAGEEGLNTDSQGLLIGLRA
jgi:hypothetical protein